jgi:hypothetical protein
MKFKFRKIPATHRGRFHDIDGWEVGLYLDDRIEWTTFEVSNIFNYPNYTKNLTYYMYSQLIDNYNFLNKKIDIDLIDYIQ